MAKHDEVKLALELLDESMPLLEVLKESVPLLEVLKTALLTREVELAEGAARDKDDPARGAKESRKAIAHSLLSVLSGPIRAVLKSAGFSDATNSLREAHDLLQKSHAEVIKLRETIHNDDVMRFLHPHAPFLNRLKQGEKEKRLIAKRVTKNYFRHSDVRAFVQASTLSIVLGREISLNGSDGLLIHTNSVPFPLTVLHEKCGKIVYTFCGSLYDPICAGWLFPRSEVVTREELKKLFTRDEKPLDTAFIMPLLVQSDGTLYYQRDETTALVEILVEHAKNVVILVTADRLTNEPAGSDRGLSPTSLPETTPDKSIELITCGSPHESLSQESLVDGFTSKRIVVHWKLPEEEGWKEFRRDDSGAPGSHLR